MDYLATGNNTYVSANSKNLFKIVGGVPIEVNTSEEMDALCISDNIGLVYKYVGPTSLKYLHDNFYVITGGNNGYLGVTTLH